jgi:arylsulfatase A-like enzyme
MKRGLLLILAVSALMMGPLLTSSYAAIGDYDLSSPKDGDVDGKDLAAWIASPGPDIAGFAGFFGQTYSVSTRKPNILLIIGDDIGFDVTTDMYPGLITGLFAQYGPSGYNHPNASLINGPNSKPASTPSLDQLAGAGKVFSNAWAQPFCSPTRASIITGLFAKKHDVITYADPLNQIHTSFVKKLRDEASYSTGAFGKWHLAGFPVQPNVGMMPKKAGFELYKGGLGAAPSSYWNTYEYVVQDGTTTDTGTNPGNLQPRTLPGITATTYSPVVQGADTIEWINARQAEDSTKPWFAYLAFNLSHATGGTPMMVVPDKDTLDCHSTDPNQDGPACKEIKGCYGGIFGGTSIGSCNGEKLMRAMTTSMDTVIGKVLAAVALIPSDTYVIYISDNGTPMYTTGGVLGPQIGNMYITRTGRGKGTTYESGALVPLAIKGPGIAAGSKSSEFVHAADVFSTILELAGLTPPENVPNYAGSSVPLDSKSLTPILFGSASTVRDLNNGYILTESQNLMPGGGNAIWVGARNGTYKVVCTSSTSNCTFYNLVDDPLEEYPLTKPGSCTGWTTADPEWHYCRLIDVIDTYSIF